MKSPKLSHINRARLKAVKKALRDTSVRVKPMVTKDKRKEQNKRECRRYAGVYLD
jgi:hypothetical protein